MAFQGIEDFEIEFIGDFFDGLEQIRGDDAFLIQCSAHPKVHEVTERHWREVFVVDTFIYPTKALAVLSRREVERPRDHLGSSPPPRATSTAPIGRRSSTSSLQAGRRAKSFSRGRYDAGLTHMEHLEDTPTSCASTSRSAKSTPPGSSTGPRSDSRAR